MVALRVHAGATHRSQDRLMMVKPKPWAPVLQHRGPMSCEAPLIPNPRDTATSTADDKFDDEHYPAYTMGRAAEMLSTTPGFLRSLDEAKLIEPQRSPG